MKYIIDSLDNHVVVNIMSSVNLFSYCCTHDWTDVLHLMLNESYNVTRDDVSLAFEKGTPEFIRSACGERWWHPFCFERLRTEPIIWEFLWDSEWNEVVYRDDGKFVEFISSFMKSDGLTKNYRTLFIAAASYSNTSLVERISNLFPIDITCYTVNDAIIIENMFLLSRILIRLQQNNTDCIYLQIEQNSIRSTKKKLEHPCIVSSYAKTMQVIVRKMFHVGRNFGRGRNRVDRQVSSRIRNRRY